MEKEPKPAFTPRDIEEVTPEQIHRDGLVEEETLTITEINSLAELYERINEFGVCKS